MIRTVEFDVIVFCPTLYVIDFGNPRCFITGKNDEIDVVRIFTE